MTKILHIESATTVCSVALSDQDRIIAIKESHEPNAHSKVLSVFIESIFKESGMKPADIDAVAVSKGPGSYTGLRIGVSSAKGLCYALDKPLISINSLHSMAAGIETVAENTLLCPMIDARRMEVYTAFYDHSLKQVRETKAEIIDENSFAEELKEHKLLMFGDGATKCKSVFVSHPNVSFLDDFNPSSRFMLKVALEKFENEDFEDVAYFEPFYLKDFVAGKPKVKGLR